MDLNPNTSETKIYYSKAKLFIEIVPLAFCLIMGIYFIQQGSILIGSFVGLVGIYFTVKYYQKIKDREPQIILNSDGIIIKGTDIILWSKISDINIKTGYSTSTDDNISLEIHYRNNEIKKSKTKELVDEPKYDPDSLALSKSINKSLGITSFESYESQEDEITDFSEPEKKYQDSIPENDGDDDDDDEISFVSVTIDNLDMGTKKIKELIDLYKNPKKNKH